MPNLFFTILIQIAYVSLKVLVIKGLVRRHFQEPPC